MERIWDKGYSMNLINEYGGTSRYGNNKEKEIYDKKKTISPKILDIKSATYSSFDMDTSKELINQKIEKVGRDIKGIKTSDIISSYSEKSIRMGKDFINDYRGASRYGNNKEKPHRKKLKINPSFLKD